MSFWTEVSNWLLGTYRVRTTQLDPPFSSVVQHIRIDQGDGSIPNDVSVANPLVIKQGYFSVIPLTPVAGFIPQFSTVLIAASNPDRAAFEMSVTNATDFIYFGWDFFPNTLDYSFRIGNKETYSWRTMPMPPQGELYAYTEATTAEFTITEYNRSWQLP